MWVDRTKHVLPSVWAGIREGSLVRVSLQEKARLLEDCLAGDTGNHERCASFDLWAGLCVPRSDSCSGVVKPYKRGGGSHRCQQPGFVLSCAVEQTLKGYHRGRGAETLGGKEKLTSD